MSARTDSSSAPEPEDTAFAEGETIPGPTRDAFDDARTIPEPPAAPPTTEEGEDISSDWALRSCPLVDFEGLSCPALGGYVVLGRVGRGGMGVVYYGRNPRLQNEVAIKILPPDLAARAPGLTERFIREARLAAKLRSEHLVQTLDVDREDSSGLHYLVMEYVKGQTARGWSRAFKDASGHRTGASEPAALDLTIAATRGLVAAHLEGVVHRDVKPENILIPTGEDGAPQLDKAKLSDLGLARMEDGGDNLTQTQAGMGTAGYMPPEQARDLREARKPADVFSMGATLYALLATVAPFRGETAMNKILATIGGDYTPLREVRPDVSAGTAALIDRCLATEPGRRYPDAVALLEALEACREALGEADPQAVLTRLDLLLQREEQGKRVATAGGSSPVAPRGSRGTLVAVVLLLVVAIAGALAWQAGWLRPPPEVATPGGVGFGTAKRDDPAPPPATAASFEGVQPPSGAQLRDAAIVLRGTVSGAGVRSVSVAGLTAIPDAKGRFELKLSLAEGEHALTLVANGDAGPLGTLAWRVVADRTPPVLTLAAPAEGHATAAAEVTLRGTASDAGGVTLTREGAPVPLTDGAFEVRVALEPGANALELIARDPAGNESRIVRNVVRDATKPAITIESPVGLLVTQANKVLVRGRVRDATVARVTVAGTPAKVVGDRFEATVLLRRHGAATLRVLATDRVGNTASTDVRVFLDRTRPTLTLSTPKHGDATRALKLPVRGRVDDEHPGQVTVNGQEAALGADGTFALELPLAEGDHVLVVIAFDRAGNKSLEQKLRVRVDRSPPRIVLDKLPANIKPGRVTITGTVDEDDCVVVIDGAAATVRGRKFGGRVQVRRGRKVVVTATDKAGNHSRTSTLITTSEEVVVGSVDRVNTRWKLVLVRSKVALGVRVGEGLLARRDGQTVGKLEVVRVVSDDDRPGEVILSCAPRGGSRVGTFRAGDEVVKRKE